MAEHGGEAGGHVESHASSSGGGHGGGLIETLFNAVGKTVDGIMTPVAQLPLDVIEDVRPVVQGATNLGAQPAKGGGGGAKHG